MDSISMSSKLSYNILSWLVAGGGCRKGVDALGIHCPGPLSTEDSTFKYRANKRVYPIAKKGIQNCIEFLLYPLESWLLAGGDWQLLLHGGSCCPVSQLRTANVTGTSRRCY